MVTFQVRPEQPDQIPGELGQRDVIHGGLAFPQVVYEQVADRAALHLVAVDQFLDGALPGGLQERPAGDRRVRPRSARPTAPTRQPSPTSPARPHPASSHDPSPSAAHVRHQS